jgi:hypothetical protein
LSSSDDHPPPYIPAPVFVKPAAPVKKLQKQAAAPAPPAPAPEEEKKPAAGQDTRSRHSSASSFRSPVSLLKSLGNPRRVFENIECSEFCDGWMHRKRTDLYSINGSY